MPWTGPEFQARHAHALSPSHAAHAARVANAILRTGGNEGMAIATAIAREKGRAEGGYIPGMTEVGNIDLHNRPVVHNPDGTISTVRSMNFGDDKGRQVLAPTVVGGRIVSPDQAIQHYYKTGQHLGIFDTPDNAESYARSLHEDQAREYQGRALGGGLVPSYAIGGSTPMKDAQVEYFPDPDWTTRLFRYGRPGNFIGDPTMERKPHGADAGMENVYTPDIYTRPGDIPEPLKHGRPTYQYGGAPNSPALPSVTTANPIYQGLYRQYQNMTPEQLQEFVLRAGNTSQGQVAQRILQQRRMMPAAIDTALSSQQPQAPQVQVQQPQPQGYALGGGGMGMSMSQADPWWTRRESTEAADGFLHSSVPGRTDHIPASPAADSYVVPADVVSGLGEGNSLAGARILEMAFGTGPYGTRMPRAGGHGSGLPHPRAPAVPQESRGGARQGHGEEKVPIMAAGGEFIIPPHVVRAIGRGDRDRGLNLLDKWVVGQRKSIVKTMSRLPGPVRT